MWHRVSGMIFMMALKLLKGESQRGESESREVRVFSNFESW